MAHVVDRIPCTFPDCNLTFTTEKELKKHKSFLHQHVYCRRCDQDFKYQESLLMHKIESSRHIVCHVCGEEFRSDGGKVAHAKQFHASEHDIKCPGCKESFVRASSLISHLEGEFCSMIDKYQYKALRVQKRGFKAALDQTSLASPSITNPRIPNASVVSDADGGVGVSLLEEDVTDSVPNENRRKAATPPPQAQCDLLDEPDEGVRLSPGFDVEDWPAPGVKGKEKAVDPPVISFDEEDDDDDEMEDLMNFSDTQSIPPDVMPPLKSNHNVKEGESSNYAADRAKWAVYKDPAMREADGDGGVTTGGYLYDTDRFYNHLLGKYMCECDQTFETAKELESHIQSGVHAAGLVRCPACLRIFKSHSALAAHAESATTRCHLRETEDYGQFMDDISAGLVEAAGFHHDGSVRYAGKKEIDLDKVNW